MEVTQAEKNMLDRGVFTLAKHDTAAGRLVAEGLVEVDAENEIEVRYAATEVGQRAQLGEHFPEEVEVVEEPEADDNGSKSSGSESKKDSIRKI